MGRHAEGWKLRPPGPKNTRYQVYFTHNGERYERTTGETDKSRGAKAAARIYSDIVNGREPRAVAAKGSERSLLDDIEEWLKYYGATHTKNAASLTAARSRAIACWDHFQSYGSITFESVRSWGVTRLGQVTRKYHRKERSTLRVFLSWAHAKGYHAETFEFSPLPKGNNGVRVTKQKVRATILPPERVEALLAAMPERSPGGGGKALLVTHDGRTLPLSAWARVYGVSMTTLYYRHVKKMEPFEVCVDGLVPVAAEPELGLWVRPFFEVLWETGLRPITVQRIQAGVHYTKGSDHLIITDEIDKISYGRKLPLTDRARAALDLAYPASGGGYIFGLHDREAALELAKRAARPPTPTSFSMYDFRHSRLTDVISITGDITGGMYMAGHKDMATTSVYVQGQEKDAARMLAAYAAKNKEKQS